ncbi:TPR_REGION domain-containing protein [Candidatus Nitrotoga sp. HW29]|uniref:tetratricopeptide repeat protein n=1 Tax=Candidatus Nitrotoga sp. HW29 TaxID=2886963 RepID=UPI001EF2DCB1|nr:tetratricopeptide repeat protein [Candidatus Nitrotoga sp. HW29]CAH1904794.1 TPR_REGION domain-containing protein [Candidatus Nitrotoga sp. HW29]
MRLKIFAFLMVSMFQSYGFAEVGFTVTKAELASMPPYCTALYGKYHGMPQPQDSPLRHTIPAGCPSVHHYCDGLKYILRADHAMGNKADFSYNMQNAITSFNGVTEEWRSAAPTCSLRAEAHTNLAKSLLRMVKRQPAAASQAINSLKQAIELTPGFLQSYLVLADTYIDNGQKRKAKEIVEEGLAHIPNSKALAKRYVALGGNPSTIKPVTKPTPAATEGNVTVDKISQPIEVKPAEVKPAEVKPAEVKPAEVKPAEVKPAEVKPAEVKSESNTGSEPPSKSGSQKSPYCRFCPED